MASNILGKIAIALGLDSAAFEKGTDKASKLAQKSAKEITEHFQGAGEKIGSFFEKFGEAGGPLAGAFSGIGGSVGGVLNSLGPLAGALGPVGLGIAGVAAAGVAASAALMGVAVHASAAAAEIYDLSLKTGVSVETLTRFGFAAKQDGIDQQSFANALEKMSRSAFQAATATTATITAYERLGISVKDASGHLKDSEALLLEVADKFAKMADGPAKTALAMQLFGKSGAEMIPLLDRGSAAIKKMGDTADILGVTLSGATAKSAKEFQEKLDLVSEAMTGIGNVVLKDLLPIMTSFMDFVDHALTDQNSAWRVLGSYLMDVLVPIVKILASAIEIVVTLVSNTLDVIMVYNKELFAAFTGLGHVIADALSGNFIKAEEDAQKTLGNMVTMAVDSGKRIADSWKSTFGNVKEMWVPTASKAESKSPTDGGVNTTGSDEKTAQAAIDKFIVTLKDAAASEAALATATRQSRGETLAITAIEEARKKVMDEIQTIEGTYGKARAEQLIRQKDALITLAAAASLYKSISADQTAINNEIVKTQQATTATQELRDAYNSGSQDAIYLAEKHQALITSIQKVADAQELINTLIKDGAMRTLEGRKEIDTLNIALGQEQTNLKTLSAEYDASQQAKFAGDLAKETQAIEYNIAALQGKIAATQLGGDALREYAVQQQELNYLQAHPGMNAISPEFEAYKKSLEDQSNLQDRLATVQSASANLRIKDIQEEINELEDLRKEYQKYGEDTIGIDAKIHQDHQQMLQDEARLLEQTDRWQNGFKAAMLNIQAQTKTTAQLISDTMQKAFNGLLDNIVAASQGAKTSFKSLLHEISTEIEKFLLSSLITKFLKMFMGSNFAGNLGGGMLFGSGSIFGGGLASGGSVAPGTTYLVGEQGPELFTSGTGGSIIPNNQVSGGGSPTVNYIIDARGADAGAEQRIHMALRASENRSVMRSVATMNEMRKRS